MSDRELERQRGVIRWNLVGFRRVCRALQAIYRGRQPSRDELLEEVARALPPELVPRLVRLHTEGDA